MYRVTGKEIIEEDRRYPYPCAGATDPIALQNELKLMLAYRVAEQDWETKFNGIEQTVSNENGELWAIIVFPHVVTSLWSAINDEGLSNHPLYSNGLKFYSVHSVKNSHFEDFFQRDDFPTYHTIFTFKDSTFECVHREEPTLSLYQDYDRNLLEYLKIQFGS